MAAHPTQTVSPADPELADPEPAASDAHDDPRHDARHDARYDPREHPHGFPVPPASETVAAAHAVLMGRPLVLVGLMGVGKTTVGRQVAHLLDRPFVDADEAIEDASRMSVADLFERYGEAEFRSLERRVIDRLLRDGATAGGTVLATGGGAFMQEETRAAIAELALTVWLRADLDVLVERTGKRDTRPLLRGGNPREILARLIDERHPVYAEADLEVESTRQRREVVASRVVHAVARSGEGAGRDGG